MRLAAFRQILYHQVERGGLQRLWDLLPLSSLLMSPSRVLWTMP